MELVLQKDIDGWPMRRRTKQWRKGINDCASLQDQEKALWASLWIRWHTRCQWFLTSSRLLIIETKHLGKSISSTGSKYSEKRSSFLATHIFTSDLFLWTRQWVSGFDKNHGIYWLAKGQLDPLRLCCIKLYKEWKEGRKIHWYTKKSRYNIETDKQTDGRTDGRRDGRMDGWMDGYRPAYILITFNL
jgi:hypothetical protein